MARRLFAALRALVVMTLFGLLWIYFVPRWFAGREVFQNPRPYGWIVVAVGLAIGLPCVWEFAWRGFGTPAPFDPPRRLVVTGPYRFVRNPMYVGFGLVLLGEAIVFPNSAKVLLPLIVILWGAVSLFIIGYEEPTLRRMFGAEYEAYCRQVRRWIPRLRPWYSAPHLE